MVVSSGAQEEETAEHEYEGVVRQLKSDPSKFFIDCLMVREWYGTDARLSEKRWPEGAKVGDAVRFKLGEDKAQQPVAAWAKKLTRRAMPKASTSRLQASSTPSALRKRPTAETDAGFAGSEEELYVGEVSKQSVKDRRWFIIDCPVVTEWYGTKAKASRSVLPEGVELGDRITFSLEEGAEEPRVAWAEAQPRKRARPASGSAGDGAWASDRQWQQPSTKPSAVKMASALKVPRTVVPESDGEEEEVKAGEPLVAELRFHEPEAAEDALLLFDRRLNGAELKVEMAPNSFDLTKIRVTGIPEGTHEMELRKHFAEAGTIANFFFIRGGGGKGKDDKGKGGMGKGGKKR
mmetsp:Transcript_7289/g.15805  ORF Transcript_7289/g.15805 Transcript_7289/m.15805 type:complete len:349 (-) Transcript_7289:40-1086(-)